MTLRTGITTGTCAAAASKAAATVLCANPSPASVEIRLPRGEVIGVPVLYARKLDEDRAVAAVRKDAGDDPDATHGLEIIATVSFLADGDVLYRAGEGVGIVTKPGLQIPPGQPAINPVPRQMIRTAIRQITPRPVCVEVSIPGGHRVAARTFNPRLGIEGGLSILGTTGIVRPYCIKALRDALRCTIDVAAACGVSNPVLVPGNIGTKAARAHFHLGEQQVIEVSNEWGFVLGCFKPHRFANVLLAGHPGKLAKLAEGEWDTHSSRSANPTAAVAGLLEKVLGMPAPQIPTVEGLFASLQEPQRRQLGDALAQCVGAAVSQRLAHPMRVAVFLVNMAGECLGTDGDLTPWR